MRYLLSRTGPLSLGVNQYGGFVRSRSDLGQPDLQLYFNPVTYSKTPQGKRPLLSPDPYAGFIMSFQPCRPLSRGRVDIRSIDPLVPPDIKPNYLSEADDLKTVIYGGRLIGQLSHTQAIRELSLGSVGPTPEHMSDAEIVSDFRDRADTVFHPVGTCAMGRDPLNSVVDPRLKVHGIAGLRVVDASVFPNVTSGNTNAPTIMVAYKAAGMILDDVSTSRGANPFHE
jgi:choline dehydrogenase